jgi:hypothetical protein
LTTWNAGVGSGVRHRRAAIGGGGSWQRVTTLAAGIAEALGCPLSIAAIYDRDYYSDEQISEVISALSQNLKLTHVHERKEIENYLLMPTVLDRALNRSLVERATRRGVPAEMSQGTTDL